MRAIRLLVPTALLAIAGMPAPAPAQQHLPTLVASARADSVHTAGLMRAETTHRWRDAARLHRESARLRELGDAQAFRCFKTAAHLSYAANDPMGARNDMKRAAARALQRGDLEQAAQAYVDVAWLAQQQGKLGEVWTFGTQAEVLAASPRLSAAERAGVLKRITHTWNEMAVTAPR